MRVVKQSVHAKLSALTRRRIVSGAKKRKISASELIELALDDFFFRERQEAFIRQIAARSLPKPLEQVCRGCGATFRAWVVEDLEAQIKQHSCCGTPEEARWIWG